MLKVNETLRKLPAIVLKINPKLQSIYYRQNGEHVKLVMFKLKFKITSKSYRTYY